MTATPKPITRPGSTEAHTALVHAILIALGTRTDLKVWKSNTGAALMPVGPRGAQKLRKVMFGVVGQADISGLLRIELGSDCAVGIALFIECKTGNAVQRPEQIKFQQMVESMGAVYLLARDAEQAVADVEAAIARISRAISFHALTPPSNEVRHV